MVREYSGKFCDVWENFGEKGKMVILRLKVGRDSSWGISDIPVKPEWSNYERIESYKFSAGFSVFRESFG